MDFESYEAAYNTGPKVTINFDKFAEDLYYWKQSQSRYYKGPEVEKPRLEDYLVLISEVKTAVAKSSGIRHTNTEGFAQ